MPTIATKNANGWQPWGGGIESSCDAEFEATFAARRLKAAAITAQGRINALESRIVCLEAALASKNGGGITWQDFPEVFLDATKPLIGRIRDLEARIKILEGRKYMGVHKPGATYSEGSWVTRDGSIFTARKTTRETLGDGCQDWTIWAAQCPLLEVKPASR